MTAGDAPTCPRCGAPVVLADDTHPGSVAFGPMFSAPTEAERLAACVEHGHAPWNRRTIERHRDR